MGKGKKHRRKRIYGLLLLVCMILSACKGESVGPQVEEAPEMTYMMAFVDIPDPDEALDGSPLAQGRKNWFSQEKGTIYREEKVYRLLALIEMREDGSQDWFGYVLQTFQPDTGQWKETDLTNVVWIEGTYASIGNLVGATDTQVYLTVTVYGEKEITYLVSYDGTAPGQICQIPEGMASPRAYWGEEQTVWLMESSLTGPGSRLIVSWSEEETTGKRYTPEVDYLLNMTWNPMQGTMGCVGAINGNLVYWPDVTEGKKLETNLRSDTNVVLACDKEGTAFLGKTDGIWKLTEQAEQRIDFAEKGYRLEKLYSMNVLQDGRIVCYVKLDGVLCRMELREVTVQEEEALRQELVIGVFFENTVLEKMVTKFNRLYPGNHVSLEKIPEMTVLQGELAAGKGPDLLLLSDESFHTLASAGYLKALEDVVEDPSLFVEAALETGKLGNSTYGIPFDFRLTFPKFSGALVPMNGNWTVEEMMHRVEQAEGVISLATDTDGSDLVFSYGLADTDNTAYIDWNMRKSHLAEQPFRELVEFAKRYQEKAASWEEAAERFSQGSYAAEGSAKSMSNLGFLDRYEALWNRNESYVGFPNQSGEGSIFVRADILGINRSSDKESAEEFLRYLLTEEAQRKCDTYGFPVRKSTLEYLIGMEQKKKDAPQTLRDDLLFWEEDGLDEKQLAQFADLLGRAKPFPVELDGLYEIVREELDPYFAGNRPIEESLYALDNRVQLYLDEK